jgi:hypothetical protein
MSHRFSGIGKWYKAEVGDAFNHQEFMEDEYAGERALFEIDEGTERISAGIGDGWYYAEVGDTDDKRESLLSCRPYQPLTIKRYFEDFLVLRP